MVRVHRCSISETARCHSAEEYSFVVDPALRKPTVRIQEIALDVRVSVVEHTL